MFGLQPTHMLIILVVAVLFFVPSRLPELVRAVRQSMVELRRSLKEENQNQIASLPRPKDSEK